jgi:hypothetical protein
MASMCELAMDKDLIPRHLQHVSNIFVRKTMNRYLGWRDVLWDKR